MPSKTPWYLARKLAKSTRRNRLRKTGWTHDEYQAAFLRQQGSCAICGTHQSELKVALNADHSHKTGRKRGLLCPPCNKGIGCLDESVELLQSALVYLERWN